MSYIEVSMRYTGDVTILYNKNFIHRFLSYKIFIVLSGEITCITHILVISPLYTIVLRNGS